MHHLLAQPLDFLLVPEPDVARDVALQKDARSREVIQHVGDGSGRDLGVQPGVGEEGTLTKLTRLAGTDQVMGQLGELAEVVPAERHRHVILCILRYNKKKSWPTLPCNCRGLPHEDVRLRRHLPIRCAHPVCHLEPLALELCVSTYVDSTYV